MKKHEKTTVTSYESKEKWQCVKTNSTPVVHIKIAGIYGCSFPKNGINGY